MKKTFLFCVAICAMVLFSACSSDNNEPQVGPITKQTVYTTAKNLTLTYNGQAMPDKRVVFTPNASDPNKATILLEGYADLQGLAKNSQVESYMGPGIIPGSASFSIPVNLNISGNECTFSGNSENTYCTFKYAGRASADKMELSISEVTLKNTSLAGKTWTPAPLNDSYSQEPIHIVWESSTLIDIFGTGVGTMPIENLLKLAIRMPIIPFNMNGEDTKVSVDDMLCYTLKSVKFGADGNISATYIDAANGGTTEVASPANIAQYVITGDNTMKIFIDPVLVIKAIKESQKSKADVNVDLNQIIKLFTNGFDLKYKIENGTLTAYLGTETLLPLLQQLSTVLDDDTINMIVEAMKNNDSTKDYAAMVEGILKSLPKVIQTTTKVEVGINLIEK